MFCDKCGTKIDDNATVCPKCGNETPNANRNTAKIKKPISKKTKVKLILAIIVIIIVVIPIMIIASPSGRIVSSFYGNNCSKASQIYFDNFSQGDSSFILDIGLNKVIDSTADKLMASKISYDEAEEIILTIDNMGISKLRNKLAETVDKISDIKTFEEAKQLIEEGKYMEAIEKYESIPEDSSIYDEVAAEIEKAKESFQTNAISEMDSYIKDNDFDSAASLIFSVKNHNMDDIYTEIMAKFCGGVNERVTAYLESNEYSEAEDFIDDIEDKFPNEDKIAEIKDGLKANYETVILNKAEAEFQNKNYEKAASIMEEALAQDEENTKFSDKYNEYKSYLPAFISDMDYFNLDGWIDTNYSDLMDNTGKSYQRIYCVSNYAEYLLNGNYTNFDGVAGVSYDYRSTNDSNFFEVYGDGVLLYTSPTFKAGTMPQAFSINVTGVKILKISYPKDTSSRIASIFDGKLYNTNYINNANNTNTTQ